MTTTVKLPIPSLLPAATTADAAAALTISATLFRAGTAYATCTLSFDGVKARKGISAAEFKLDVKRAEGRIRSKKGLCDTNLSTGGVQRGIPSILRGDTLILEESTAGVFMDGSL